MFRTKTGQTGKDAYINELAQLQNLQRDLDARRMRLVEAMKDELTESGLTVDVAIPSGAFPDATVKAPAEHAALVVELNLLDEAKDLVNQLPTDWKPGRSNQS